MHLRVDSSVPILQIGKTEAQSFFLFLFFGNLSVQLVSDPRLDPSHVGCSPPAS